MTQPDSSISLLQFTSSAFLIRQWQDSLYEGSVYMGQLRKKRADNKVLRE